MSESIFRVVVPGDPQAWQRPRFSARGRRVFSASSLERWYDAAALAIWPLWDRSAPLSRPLRVVVDAVTARPKGVPAALKRLGWTAPRYREHKGRIPRPAAPDVDNLVKAALDALQGDLSKQRPEVIHDDALVVEVTGRKWYAAQGESARVEIEVWEVEL